MVYLCMIIGSIHGMRDSASEALFVARHYEFQRLLSGADRMVGRSVSLVARGATHSFKFCRDYPRLILFIIFITPLFSSRWRSFLFNSIGGGIASIGRRIWALIDSRLFGWMHQGIEQVQSTLGSQQEELIDQGRKIGLLKTEIVTVGDELQDQIKKLEILLMGHAQQLGDLRDGEHEISLKIDTTHSMATQHSSQLDGIQSQNTVIGERVNGMKSAIDLIGSTVNGLDEKIALGYKDLQERIDSFESLKKAFSSFEQQFGTQHRDLVTKMEQRFAALPESQRHILDEYSLQIGERFDRLSGDIDKVLRVAIMQHEQTNTQPNCDALKVKKISAKS